MTVLYNSVFFCLHVWVALAAILSFSPQPPQPAPLEVEHVYSQFPLETKAPYPISMDVPSQLLEELLFWFNFVIIITFFLATEQSWSMSSSCQLHQQEEVQWATKTQKKTQSPLQHVLLKPCLFYQLLGCLGRKM